MDFDDGTSQKFYNRTEGNLVTFYKITKYNLCQTKYISD